MACKDFIASGGGAVHLFRKMTVFSRPGPLRLNGSFLFSQLEMCAVLERGALGSLKRVRNGHPERFFECFLRWLILDRFFLSVFERPRAA